MPRFTVKHLTRYNYTVPVRDNANQIMLYPVRDVNQAVLRHVIRITNEPNVLVYKDYYGNDIGVFTQASPHQLLSIESELIVITTATPLPVNKLNSEDQWSMLGTYNKEIQFIDFMYSDLYVDHAELKTIAETGKKLNDHPLETALYLNTYVFEKFKYVKGITNVETTVDEIMAIKAGVCQDFAHILLSMLRSIQIPARYVSGYICPNQNGMRGEGATHAWVEAFIPGLNWIGLDPTNNCMVSDKHVRLAIGKSFTDCSPVKGTFKGSSMHTLEVGVSVSYDNDLHEDPVLKPVLQPKPQLQNKDGLNSYRSNRKIVERQQQQEQQQQ